MVRVRKERACLLLFLLSFLIGCGAASEKDFVLCSFPPVDNPLRLVCGSKKTRFRLKMAQCLDTKICFRSK